MNKTELIAIAFENERRLQSCAIIVFMRIIAGKFKGKRLLEPEDKSIIRAAVDRIKESVFNIIQEKFLDSKVLDSFCGTGSLGLEALSRGAASVTFVDINSYSLNLAKQNWRAVTGEKNIAHTEFLLSDYKKVFSKFKEEGKKFDIIFLYPPYNKNEDGECVRLALENELLDKDGVIIFETIVDSLEFKNVKVDKRKYGRKYIYLCY